MNTYESPAIVEIGTVADLTQGRSPGFLGDGLFTRTSGGGGTPTS